MRTRLLKLLFFLLPFVCGAQTLGKLKTAYETELATYCQKTGNSTKMISNRVFNTQIRNIFNNVIIGNGDATASGNAFAFSNDKFKNVFTLNTNIFLSKTKNILLDGGLTLTSKDNTYYYYTNKAWVNDIGVKAGISMAIGNAAQYINNVDGTKLDCPELNAKRLSFITDKFISYDSIYTNYSAINTRILTIQGLLTGKANTIVFDGATRTNLLTELKKLTAQKEVYVKKLDDAIIDATINTTIEADMDEFDKSDSFFGGHKIRWVNANISATNASFKIEGQDIINEEFQKKYKSVPKVTLETNINQQRDKVRYIETMQAFFKFNRGSFLDNPQLKGKKFTLNDVGSNVYSVVDEDGLFIDNYTNLKSPFLTGDIGGYYSNVFLLKKTIGLIGRFSYNFPIDNSAMKDYETNYSTSLGLILRVNKKDKWSAATIILTSGFDNVTFHEGANDKFYVKISAGIPFNVFDNSKK